MEKTKPTTVRVGAVQMISRKDEIEKNIDKALAYCDTAAKKGVQMLCLPECASTGFDWLGDRNAAAKGTRRMVNRSVPAATYSALCFTFGVEGNTPGTLPNQAHFDNMAWPAAMGGGGYHYMKLEGMYEDEGDEGSFAVHTGPAGGADFTFEVSLPLALTVAQDAWEIQVGMNLGEWFANPNLYNFGGLGGILGNAELQGQLQANGATVFALGSVGHLDLDELDHDHDDHGEGDHEEEDDDHSEHAEGGCRRQPESVSASIGGRPNEVCALRVGSRASLPGFSTYMRCWPCSRMDFRGACI